MAADFNHSCLAFQPPQKTRRNSAPWFIQLQLWKCRLKPRISSRTIILNPHQKKKRTETQLTQPITPQQQNTDACPRKKKKKKKKRKTTIWASVAPRGLSPAERWSLWCRCTLALPSLASIAYYEAHRGNNLGTDEIQAVRQKHACSYSTFTYFPSK